MNSTARPIFILGCHKSGSTLLRSLLDDHPDLAVMPLELHFPAFGGCWTDYALRRKWPEEVSLQEWQERVLAHADECTRVTDPYSDAPGLRRLDIARAREYLEDRSPDTPQQLIVNIMHAVYLGATGELPREGMRFVEKSVDNAEHAPLLARWFADCSFVHIVRNPYASLVAIRKAKSRNGFPYLRNAIQSLENSSYNLFRNEALLTNYTILRYEDLVADPEGTMKKVAAGIEVDFGKTMLRPTVCGEPWPGNSTTGVPPGGISDAPLSAWQEAVTPVEIKLVNRFLAPVLERFGYPRLEMSRRKILCSFADGMRNYCRHRMYLWTA